MFDSVFCEVTALFPLVLVHSDVLCVQVWSLSFHQFSGSPIITFCWLLKSDSLGILTPLSYPQGGKPDMGLRTFTLVGKLMWFYSFHVPHLVVMGLNFIIIVPLLPSHCGFFFVFGCRVSF